MTVYEVVKRFGLEGFEKNYKEPNGMAVPLPNLDRLMITTVKDVYINLMMRTATITILWEE